MNIILDSDYSNFGEEETAYLKSTTANENALNESIEQVNNGKVIQISLTEIFQPNCNK